jgi:hypothetical protein
MIVVSGWYNSLTHLLTAKTVFYFFIIGMYCCVRGIPGGGGDHSGQRTLPSVQGDEN